MLVVALSTFLDSEICQNTVRSTSMPYSSNTTRGVSADVSTKSAFFSQLSLSGSSGWKNRMKRNMPSKLKLVFNKLPEK